ncbi:MAG: ABC transporter substrate-binding protein [Xanthobacteraceae bacterium]
MKRRDFIALIGGAAVARPLVARAQQAAMPVIGFLHFATPEYTPNAAEFLQGLRKEGYVEGKNVAIEYRYAEGHYDRSAALAADLVARKVDLIAAFGPPLARAAKNATATIPIVFEVGSDAVADGLVASLARPGGNATGASILFTAVTGKRIEYLSELVPDLKVVAVLVNPNSPTAEPTIKDAQVAAGIKNVQIRIVKATTESDIDGVFASLAELHAGALVVGADPFFDSRREQFIALAARYAIPTIYFAREFTVSGGLISYGTNLSSIYRLMGEYAGKILKGTKPADLPVQQPTAFTLCINLKTAKALGLTVPQSLLATADEVIE